MKRCRTYSRARSFLLAPPTHSPPSPISQLDSSVIRIPIVPGSDPRLMYGDLAGRGVRGVVLEAFGVGNLPDDGRLGWLPWLRDQRRKVCGGVSVSVSFGRIGSVDSLNNGPRNP